LSHSKAGSIIIFGRDDFLVIRRGLESFFGIFLSSYQRRDTDLPSIDATEREMELAAMVGVPFMAMPGFIHHENSLREAKL